MCIKHPTTFEQQLEKLKERGCIIGDETFAKIILEQINYYRLTAYFLPFRKDDGKYKEGTTFNKIFSIYEFDRKLRNLILSAVEEIELMVRTQLAYYHSVKYGALGYKKHINFNPKHKHEEFEEKVKTLIKSNKTKAFVKHHIKKYDGNFPLWVLVELLTMGQVSRFYSDMHRADKKALAKKLFCTSDENVTSWLICLTHIRNDCAHYSRLYYTKFGTTPSTPTGYPYKLKDKIFDYILVLKFLYPDPVLWKNRFVPALEALIEQYSNCITLECMGFPSNWEELLIMPNPKINQ